MKVAVVGATGLIGRRLVEALLGRGWDVVPVSRRGEDIAGAAGVRWDPAVGDAVPAELLAADAVVNLAGAGIGDARWTDARKRLIRDSRVDTTRALVAALGDGGPRVLVNGSAIGFYGTGEGTRTEASPAGTDFLAGTCVAWEAEALAAEAKGVRVVLLRTGIVMAAEGGALKKQLPLFNAGVGGPLGGGRQWQSWVHIGDVTGLIAHAIERDDVTGPLNATAPGPVRQKEFARTLGRVLGRPAFLPTPGIALRLALGEMSTLALDGQRVEPAAALASGYAFGFTELEPALRDVLSRD